MVKMHTLNMTAVIILGILFFTGCSCAPASLSETCTIMAEAIHWDYLPDYCSDYSNLVEIDDVCDADTPDYTPPTPLENMTIDPSTSTLQDVLDTLNTLKNYSLPFSTTCGYPGRSTEDPDNGFYLMHEDIMRIVTEMENKKCFKTDIKSNGYRFPTHTHTSASVKNRVTHYVISVRRAYQIILDNIKTS